MLRSTLIITSLCIWVIKKQRKSIEKPTSNRKRNTSKYSAVIIYFVNQFSKLHAEKENKNLISISDWKVAIKFSFTMICGIIGRSTKSLLQNYTCTPHNRILIDMSNDLEQNWKTQLQQEPLWEGGEKCFLSISIDTCRFPMIEEMEYWQNREFVE